MARPETAVISVENDRGVPGERGIGIDEVDQSTELRIDIADCVQVLRAGPTVSVTSSVGFVPVNQAVVGWVG